MAMAPGGGQVREAGIYIELEGRPEVHFLPGGPLTALFVAAAGLALDCSALAPTRWLLCGRRRRVLHVGLVVGRRQRRFPHVFGVLLDELGRRRGRSGRAAAPSACTR